MRGLKAVAFDPAIPRYVWTRAWGAVRRPGYWGRWSPLQLRELPRPEPPGSGWARIRTLMAGICGSDLNLVTLRDSPVASVYSSFPFVVGHEGVGRVDEAAPGFPFPSGQRVVVDPILSCVPRGIDPPCEACARGDFSQCERMAQGRLAPGLLAGACRDTGGTWAEYFLAHASQVFAVPEEVGDEAAALVEPFATALHAVLRNRPRPGERVLVVGAGVIGLLVVAALKALGEPAPVTVLARHPFQAELARQLGADRVLLGRGPEQQAELARALGVRLLRPILGAPVPESGADLVYECVGRDEAIDQALRFTRPGGRVVLVGLAGVTRKVDWTFVWMRELTVRGTFAYSTEEVEGRRLRTFQLALELLARGGLPLERLVTHRFPLAEVRAALATATSKAARQALKVLLVP